MNKTINIQSTAVIYVDDLFFTCKDINIIKATMKHIETHLNIKLEMETNPRFSYLGMIWDFSENKKCKISMLAYTLDLLQEYGVTGKADSPAAEHLFQTRLDTQKLDTHTK
jgi:hypothetical protein